MCGHEETPLEINVRKNGLVQIIHLQGDLRLEAVDQFRRAGDELVGAGDARLVVNVAGVRMIDSSGIGVLVRLLTAAAKVGGGMKLVQPSKLALQTLKITGLTGIIPIFDDEAAAIASFS